MSELAKARLQEIEVKDDGSVTEIGDPILVQFNPNALKLQISNSIEGNKSRGRQVRQYIGSSSTSLTLDLIFDTADEGTTANPRSVTEKTDKVQKFVIPTVEGKKKHAPPKIRFHWGKLVMDGVVESLTIEFDHFAADGTPLRAKVPLTIKEQDSKYQFLSTGPGANQDKNVPEPGKPSLGAMGSIGGGIGGGSRSALAIGGESAAEFAARVGLDPSAWRGLSAGLGNTLSLEAGLEIGFDANLSLNAGIGVSVGIEAGVSTSLEAAFGLEGSPSITAVSGVGGDADLAAGFALSAAGGVSAAIESVKIANYQASEEQTRKAFGLSPSLIPSSSSGFEGGASNVRQSSLGSSGTGTIRNTGKAATRPTPPTQVRTPLKSSGLPSPAMSQGNPPAPLPPRADSRATSFGSGVPLRPTIGSTAVVRNLTIQGTAALQSKINSGKAPVTNDPTTLSWVALQAQDQGRRFGDNLQRLKRPLKFCGCMGACKHREVK